MAIAQRCPVTHQRWAHPAPAGGGAKVREGDLGDEVVARQLRRGLLLHYSTGTGGARRKEPAGLYAPRKEEKEVEKEDQQGEEKERCGGGGGGSRKIGVSHPKSCRALRCRLSAHALDILCALGGA